MKYVFLPILRYVLIATSPPNLPFFKGRNAKSIFLIPYWYPSLLCIEPVFYSREFFLYCILALPLQYTERIFTVLKLFLQCIESSLFIAYRVVMQHTSPLKKGRLRGDYLHQTQI